MRLILRRLSEAIVKQNWTTVTVEVLVVIVGIFIGLQVDDWNQARKDGNDELRFLERLGQAVRDDASGKDYCWRRAMCCSAVPIATP